MFSTTEHRREWHRFIIGRLSATANIDVAIRMAVFPDPKQRDKLYMDCVRELRATRHWFAGREGGWTPAERVRRSPYHATEWWSE